MSRRIDHELQQEINGLNISPNALIDPETGEVYEVGIDIPGSGGTAGSTLDIEDNGVLVEEDVQIIDAATALRANLTSEGEVSLDIPGAPGAQIGDVFTKTDGSTFGWEPVETPDESEWDTAVKTAAQSNSVTAPDWFTVTWDAEDSNDSTGMNAAGDEWVAPEGGERLFMARAVMNFGSSAEVALRIRNTTTGEIIAVAQDGAGSNTNQYVEAWSYNDVAAGDTVIVEARTDLTGGASEVLGGEGESEFSVAKIIGGGSGGGSGGGLESVFPADLEAVDEPNNGEIPKYNSSQGMFEWLPDNTGGGGGGGGAWATPAGTTVADIDTAIQNNDVVVLEPGVTYTNPEGATVEMPGSSNKTLICYGATIQVRSSPTIYMKEGGVGGNMLGWHSLYGGYFVGTKSAGEVAIQAEDSIRSEIHPLAVHDCECAVALTNDDLWCEYNKVSFSFRNCETGLMLIGGEGSPPAGSSVTRTNNGAGSSQSFRFLETNINGKVNQTQDAQNRGYGVYTDFASPYAGQQHISISGGDSVTAYRYHNRFNGGYLNLHSEAPAGATDGGKGFVADANERGPAMLICRIGGGVGVPFQNNTSEPIMYFDATQEPNQAYGFRVMRDGSTAMRFYEKNGNETFHLPGFQQLEMSDNDIIS